MKITISGDDDIVKKLQKVGSMKKLLDDDFSSTARSTVSGLIRKTPKKTGNTARGWQTPVKVDQSEYFIRNNISTVDRAHNIVKILNYGRGWVYPKKAKRLYIPLNNKGASKPLGGKIPNGFVFGTDFILAKKAKPTIALKFVSDIIKSESENLKQKILKTLKGL